MTEAERAIIKAIGARLPGQRQAIGISLSELSERTGGALSKSRISNYEQGIRRMGVEEAEVLAAALGTVHPAFLLGLDSEGPITTHEYAVLEAYRALEPQAQAMICRALDVSAGGVRGLRRPDGAG